MRSKSVLWAVAVFLAELALIPNSLSQPLRPDATFRPSWSAAVSMPKGMGNDTKAVHWMGMQGHRIFISAETPDGAILTILTKQGEGPKVAGVKHLAAKPLTHTGGFQLCGNWLALAVSDPRGRGRSVVQLLDVTDSRSLNQPPAYLMERKGEQGRSAASAVALIERSDHLLLAVAGWNSTVIDFYVSNSKDPRAPSFDFRPWTSYDSREADRSDWSDRAFGHYAGLQLFEQDGALHLAALRVEKDGHARVDVFEMRVMADPYTLLRKKSSATMPPTGPCTPAGLWAEGDGWRLGAMRLRQGEGVDVSVYVRDESRRE